MSRDCKGKKIMCLFYLLKENKYPLELKEFLHFILNVSFIEIAPYSNFPEMNSFA